MKQNAPRPPLNPLVRGLLVLSPLLIVALIGLSVWFVLDDMNQKATATAIAAITQARAAANATTTEAAAERHAQQTLEAQQTATALANATATSAQATEFFKQTQAARPTETPTPTPTETPSPTPTKRSGGSGGGVTLVDVTFRSCLSDGGGWVVLNDFNKPQNFNAGGATTFTKVKPNTYSFVLHWHDTKYAQHNFNGSIKIPNTSATYTINVPCDRGTKYGP